MMLLAVVYWSIDEKIGKRLILLVIGSQMVSTITKISFARPRPFQVAPDRISPLAETEGYGLPSGHTIFGTVSGSWFIRMVGKRWATVVGVIYIVVMGLSRMIHGVHFPQDVLLGWLLGGAFFAGYLLVERRISRSNWRPSPWAAVLLIVASATALFAITLALNHEFEARKSVLSVTGALAGGLIGFVVAERRIGFSAKGPIGTRVLRSLIGAPLLAGVYFGGTALFYAFVGESQSVATLILYTVRYGTVGAMVSLGVPALCRWWKL